MDGSEDIFSPNKDEKPEVHLKNVKLRTDRLKKWDDEEQWISGEELYTDGSSDEEGTKGARHKHKREHKGARPKEKAQCSEPLPKPALVVPVDSDDEQIDISWKPKRGSIKLPHMTKDIEQNSSSTSSNTKHIPE